MPALPTSNAATAFPTFWLLSSKSFVTVSECLSFAHH